MTCKVCQHSKEMVMPNAIIKQRFCTWGPPHLTMLPGPGGNMMLASPPPVTDDYECSQFLELEIEPDVN